MMEHSERPHSLLSPSGAERWMLCPPSAKLEQNFPDTTSDSAREGTLAHEICELKATNYIDHKALSKRSLNAKLKKLKEHELYKPEMDGYTDEYTEFISRESLAYDAEPVILLEQKLDLGEWIPGGFGTADCIMLQGDTLQVIDYKYGKGVRVSARRNPQLMLYALGAKSQLAVLSEVQHIKLSIVQPRIENYDTYSLELTELLAFGEEVKEKAALAIAGSGEFNPGESQCRFCRAKAQCRARAEKNIQLAFATGQKPDLLTSEQIGEYLAKGADVANWVKDLEEFALKECLAGRTVAGWKAVEGRSTRTWADQEKAFKKLNENGYEDAVLYERNPLSPAKTETLVGKKVFKELVGSYVDKKPGRPTLVPETDKREAISNIIKAAEAFKE